LVWILAAAVWSAPAWGLSPEELVVLANGRVPEGVALARDYMAGRGIPSGRLLVVPMPAGETISRTDFEQRVAAPVRRFLKELETGGQRIRCLVPVFGVPLRVAAPPDTGPDPERLRALDVEIRRLREAGERGDGDGESQKRLRALEGERHNLRRKGDGEAAVDSELALARRERYPVAGWLRNPLYPGFRGRKTAVDPDQLLLVARLDGPSPALVRRRLRETLAAEARGLRGVAYFDARWPESSGSAGAYGGFDRSIHRAAAGLKRRGWPVVLEATEALFAPGEAPNAALYCGWYRLAQYVDAFEWVPGAVGYHVASGECKTLRSGGRTPWCPGMLADGAAAVIGPVGEPYLAAFPPPDLFFRKLSTADRTLAEAYWESLPYLSWKMVLVGDPLYRPFAAAGKEKPD
jgi:uncharacterized protein (TIGR03790 family)